MSNQKKDVPWAFITAALNLLTAFINRPRKEPKQPLAPDNGLPS